MAFVYVVLCLVFGQGTGVWRMETSGVLREFGLFVILVAGGLMWTFCPVGSWLQSFSCGGLICGGCKKVL